MNDKRRGRLFWLTVLACALLLAMAVPSALAETRELTCGKEEHTHSDSCYSRGGNPVCGKEESDGHHHSDSCYEDHVELTCDKEESDGHQHSDACYDEESNLICGKEAGEGAHHHSEDQGCYTHTSVLTCGKEEGEGAHHHSDDCYELVLSCGKEEHTHSDECYTTKYTVTFKDDDKTYYTITDVAGTKVAAPADPAKDGYAFTGWQLPEGVTEIPAAIPEKDVTITAQWAKQYTVAFVDGDTAIASITGAVGTEVTRPADPTKDGYTFAGWQLPEGVTEIPTAIPEKDVTITAQWNKLYTVAFVDGDTAIASVTGAVGTEVTRPADPAKEGYVFAGWQLPEGVTEIPATIPEADVTIAAQWNKLYTVAFVDGDTVIASVTGVVGTAVERPADPAKDGYVFAGWQLPEGVEAIPETIPEADVTITAQWTEAVVVSIVGFAKPEPAAFSLTYKPSAEAILVTMAANYPTVDAILSDGVTTVKAAVSWTCSDYTTREGDGDGDYEFFPISITTEGNYPLAEGTPLPKVIFTVGATTSGAYTYRLNEAGELTVVSCAVESATVDVPEQIDGHPVTYIGAEAFKDATALTALSLPNGVKTIGASAFAGCTALTTLTFPDSLEASPDASIVQGDSKLANVTLRTSLATTLTSNKAFSHAATSADGQTSTASVALPTEITDITVSGGTLTLGTNYTVASGRSIAVGSGATLEVGSGYTLTNLGTVKNSGTVNYNGTIVTCGGAWSGNEATKKKGGSYVSEHSYKDGKCSVCGAEEPLTVTDLTIEYTGKTITKVYDKTRNTKDTTTGWTLKGSDFTISGYQSGHKSVSITAIKAAFDSANAGKRTITASFTLGGDDASRYRVSDITIPATITAKPLVITPTAGQKKVYGAADPTYYTGKVKGLLSGDTITGRLSRESGENVGKYKITQGTITAGDNYEVQVGEDYFTIEAKSINSSDVGLVTIGNQRYTGKAITPEITLRFGSNTLKQDKDFKAVFSDNVQPGTAKVKLTGMGNYTGERESTFRILNVTTTTDSSTSSGTSSGSYSHSGFNRSGYSDPESDDVFDDDDDSEDDEDDVEEDNPDGVGKLTLDDVDYGTVLYSAEGKPEAFVLFEEETATGQKVLTIIPDPMMDEETGEEIYLEDGVRERYEELHLRIGTPLVRDLLDKGYTELVYEMEQADLRVPLTALIAEIPLEAPDPVEAVEGIAATEDDEELDIAPTALQVASYDICLEQADALIQAAAEAEAEGEALDGEVLDDDTLDGDSLDAGGSFGSASGFGSVMKIDNGEGTSGPIEVADATETESVAQPEGDDAATEDAATEEDPAVIAARREAERLEEALSGYQLMMPAYRVRVRVITEEQEALATENGLEAAESERLPEGYYPQGVRLQLLPTEDVQVVPEEAQQLYISDIEDPENDQDVTELTPAEFANVDGTIYGQILPAVDGVYTITVPEGWTPTIIGGESEDYEDDAEDYEDEDDEDFEEDDEDGEDDSI